MVAPDQPDGPCDRFELPDEPFDEDEEPETLESCEGCEEYKAGVVDGLCPKCADEYDSYRDALQQGSCEVRRRLVREAWMRRGA